MKIIKKYKAKKISYGKLRSKKKIKYIVIHNTGNAGDTAKGNASYFATSNTREAGAHFFVDQGGTVYKSINMNRTAWAVGGLYSLKDGAGTLHEICTNANSVSIELCDIINKKPSDAMVDSTKALVKYIRKYCPNAKVICRHWDVNGKDCPQKMIGKDNTLWKNFKKEISK